MKDRKVSVIVPVYNAASYLESCIDSLLSQSYRPLEIICVDDGSTDESRRILEKYASKLQIIEQENSGASAARNRGWRAATGDYIKFWDADDLMNSRHIEAQVSALGGSKDMLASCKWARFYDGNPESAVFVPETVWQDLDSLEWIKKALTQRVDMAASWLWLIPQEIMVQTGGWNDSLSLNDDFEFSMRILREAKAVKFAAEAIAYYRSGNLTSLASGQTHSAFGAALKATRLGCSYLLEMENSKTTRLLCANRYQEWVYRMYPDHPELVREAEKEIQNLGGSNIQMEGGRFFQFLRKFLGWKMAKRMQLLCYKMGYKPKHPHLFE